MKYQGAGIGLSLARKIIELHNGKIWAESGKREKRGESMFRYSLCALRHGLITDTIRKPVEKKCGKYGENACTQHY